MVQLLAVESKKAYIISAEMEKVYRLNLSGNVPWNILEEKVITDYVGFKFGVDHFYFESFNQKVFQLIESGIANLIVDEEYKNNLLKKMKTIENFDINKSKLTLQHLDTWFYALLILLSLATVVFFCELMVWKIQQRKNRSKPKTRKLRRHQKTQPKLV